LSVFLIGLNDTGMWLLGTGQYLQILDSIIIGGYFFHCDTQYDTDQTAVGTIHMPVNDYLVPLLVTCTLTATIIFVDTMLICYYLLSTIVIVITDLKFYVV